MFNILAERISYLKDRVAKFDESTINEDSFRYKEALFIMDLYLKHQTKENEKLAYGCDYDIPIK